MYSAVKLFHYILYIHSLTNLAYMGMKVDLRLKRLDKCNVFKYPAKSGTNECAHITLLPVVPQIPVCIKS